MDLENIIKSINALKKEVDALRKEVDSLKGKGKTQVHSINTNDVAFSNLCIDICNFIERSWELNQIAAPLRNLSQRFSSKAKRFGGLQLILNKLCDEGKLAEILNYNGTSRYITAKQERELDPVSLHEIKCDGVSETMIEKINEKQRITHEVSQLKEPTVEELIAMGLNVEIESESED